MAILTLNIDNFEPHLRKQNGEMYILDQVRKKYFLLTPEEWVRQHLLYYLSIQGFPLSLMQVERGLRHTNRQKRFDILVRDRQGNPFLLIECKAMHIALTQQTLDQVGLYNTLLDAPHIAISNGIELLIYSYDIESQSYKTAINLPTLV